MNVEVFLTEAEIAQEFVESMEARDLPEKFFYWFPLSVRAWLDLTRNSRSQSFRQSWTELSQRASLLKAFPDSLSVISLGAGDGIKDHLLLKTLQAAGRSVRYFPVDASQALLELACAGGEDLEIETRGLKADISSPVHVVLACDAAESPKLYLMAGNTLGGFDPLDQLRHVVDCLGPEDRLILDGELDHQEAIIGDPAEQKFAFAPLASIGLTEEDGELRFERKRDERHAGLNMVTRNFRAARDLRVMLAGEDITIPRGERVFMNFRYLYSREAFQWLLRKHAGLKTLDETISADGLVMTALCAR